MPRPARTFCTSLLLALVLSACASSGARMQRALVGTWDYTVHNTPEGNVGGTLMLTAVGDGLSGTISSQLMGSTVALSNIRVMNDSLFFDADFGDLATSTRAAVEGETLEGEIVAQGYGAFRMTAQRQ